MFNIHLHLFSSIHLSLSAIFGTAPLDSEKARHLAPFPAEALAQAGWTEFETTCQRHVAAPSSNHFQSASFSAVEARMQDRDFSPGPLRCELYHLLFIVCNLRRHVDAKIADSVLARHSAHGHPHGTPSH